MLSGSNKGDDVGRISPTDDIDFYRFEAEAAGQVEIEVHPDPGLTTLTTLYDGTKDEDGDGIPDGVDTDASDSDDGISSFVYEVAAGGTYYVGVESKDQDSTGRYELHIREHDPATEPGNSETDRPPGPLPGWGGVRGVQIDLDTDGNGNSRGSLDDPSEVDWFQINGARAGNMQVTVQGVNDDLTEFVTVFRADGGGIDTDAGDNDGQASVAFTVDEDETIVAAVSSHRTRTTGAYTIEVTQPAELPDDDLPDLGETPRDLDAEVTDEGHGYLDGRIETPDDNDWFKIPVRGEGYLTIEADQRNSSLVPFLELSRDGTTDGFFETDDGRDGRARVTFLPESGITHVWAKVSPVDGTQGQYTLRVWRTPNPDDDHPDDGGRGLRGRSLGNDGHLSVTGTIEHPGDSDDFRVRAGAAGPVAVQAISLTEGFAPLLRRSRPHPDPELREESTGSEPGGRAFEMIEDVQPPPDDDWINFDVSAEAKNTSVPSGDYVLHVRRAEHPDDKHADTVGIEAWPIPVDGTGNGSLDFETSLNHAGDSDVFQVRAASARPITLTADGTANDVDTFLRVYDATGRPLMTDHDSGPNGESTVTLEAERNDLYYLEVSAFDGSAKGQYAIDVSQPTDDHSDAAIFTPKEDQERDGTEISLNGTGFQTNEAAQVENEQLVLTDDQWQKGSAWFDQLLEEDDFTANFDFEITDQGGIDWGDGFTFAVADAEVDDATAVGPVGGSLGYEGLSGFSIEFDTYSNFEHNDVDYVHVGLNAGGSVQSIATSDPLPLEILDADKITAEVEYDQGEVAVSLSSPVHEQTEVLSALVPEEHRPDQGRIGFTGATASAFQTVNIDDVTVSARGESLIAQTFNGRGSGIAAGEIGPVGDRDVFQVTAPDRGQMTVNVATTDQRLDTFLRVYDSHGNLVGTDDDGGDGRNSTLTFNSFQDETYFVEVSGYGDSSVGAYRISVQRGERPPRLFVGTYEDFADDRLDDIRWRTESRGRSSVLEAGGRVLLRASGIGSDIEENTASLESRATIADDVEFDFIPRLGANENLSHIEITDGTSFIRLQMEPGDAGGIDLTVESNGYTELANAGVQSLVADTGYHARVTESEDGIDVLLNGDRIAQFDGSLKPDSELRSHAQAIRLPVYDDFDDDSIDGGRWNTSGDVVEQGGRLHLWMYHNGRLQDSEATTAGKPGGEDLVGFHLNSNRTANTVGPGQAESEVSLTDGTNAIVIKWLNDVNEFVAFTEGNYPSASARWNPDGHPDGPLEIRQNGNGIEVLHNNTVRLTIANESVRPGSYFRADAFGKVGEDGTPLDRDYAISIDDLQLYRRDTRLAELELDNVGGTLRLPDDPVSVAYDNFDDSTVDPERWNIAGRVEERDGRLRLPLFRNGEPVSGFVSTAGVSGETNLRGFTLNSSRTVGGNTPFSWDAIARMDLTNGEDWIRIRWNLKNNAFRIETAGDYGSHVVDIPVPDDQIPDGPLEVRERDGNIEVLHNNTVKLTLEDQTVRAGSYFTFETSGNPFNQTLDDPPEDFDASIDKLHFYVDREPSELQTTPSLATASDTGVSETDHITNQLSFDVEWPGVEEADAYQWRQGTLRDDGTVDYGGWSEPQAGTAATVSLSDASIHVVSVRPIDAEGIVGEAGARAVLIDTQAPEVEDLDLVRDAATRLRITFAEPVFGTAADISIQDSDGNAIVPESLTGFGTSVLTMELPSLQADEDYTLAIDGTNSVTDIAGNRLDGDGDGTAGGNYQADFVINPRSFDFGTRNAPVTAGFVGATSSAEYDTSSGYGWVMSESGAIGVRDRGAGTDLQRDLNFSDRLAFAADLPAGIYDVSLMLGDAKYAHDRMQPLLEGDAVGTPIDTAVGEFHTVTHEVQVRDGQLNVVLQDQGGGDANVVLNALEIQLQESLPPGITVTPTDLVTSEEGTTAEFSVVLDAAPSADVTVGLSSGDSGEGALSTSSLTFTPDNWDTPQVVTVTGVDDAETDGNVAFSVITDPAVSSDGNYSGLDPVDVSVTNLDDDGVQRFDFGTGGSPVQPHFTRVAPDTIFTSAQGFGVLPEESGPVSNRDRGVGSALEQDFTFSDRLGFATELADGIYEVTLTASDAKTSHDQMELFLEGSSQGTFDVGKGDVLTVSRSVAVSDGELMLVLEDQGGGDANVVLNALEIQLQESLPPGITVTPTDLVTSEEGTTAEFSVVLDAAPSADVTVGLSSGDSGEGTLPTSSLTFTPDNWNTPQVVTVTGVDDAETDGDVAFSVITDPATSTDADYGDLDPADVSVTNLDDDGVQRFDFGTDGSPVQPHFTQVVGGTEYDAEQGFGWVISQSGAIGVRDRGAGTDLQRDLNFSEQLTFAVDVAADTYEVTVTVGDAKYGHDQMELLLEGAPVGAPVDTGAGEFRTVTHEVGVSDGQLNIRLEDGGGHDVNVVINALVVAPSASGSASTTLESSQTLAVEPISSENTIESDMSGSDSLTGESWEPLTTEASLASMRKTAGASQGSFTQSAQPVMPYGFFRRDVAAFVRRPAPFVIRAAPAEREPLHTSGYPLAEDLSGHRAAIDFASDFEETGNVNRRTEPTPDEEAARDELFAFDHDRLDLLEALSMDE